MHPNIGNSVWATVPEGKAGAFIRAAKKFYADPSSAEEVVKILDVHISSSVR